MSLDGPSAPSRPAFLTNIIRSDPNGQSWVSEE